MYDFCVIGGGIVGAATALTLLERCPGASLLLVEKAPQLGTHQTGHNSAVIQSGISYEPGSRKAERCRRGAQATRDVAAANGIPCAECGKLLVATNQVEMRRLGTLAERAAVNRQEI